MTATQDDFSQSVGCMDLQQIFDGMFEHVCNHTNIDRNDVSAWGVGITQAIIDMRQLQRRIEELERPVRMVLHCPRCGVQHIDQKEVDSSPQFVQGPNGAIEVTTMEGVTTWNNPPHRSHLCHDCGCVWRPADVATTGVKRIATQGKEDTDVADVPRRAAAAKPQGGVYMLWEQLGARIHVDEPQCVWTDFQSCDEEARCLTQGSNYEQVYTPVWMEPRQPLAYEQAQAIITNTIGFQFGEDKLQAVNEFDLENLAKAFVHCVPPSNAVPPTIDIDQLSWDAINQAARESNWIPPEYMANDWISDVCQFLRDRPEADDPLQSLDTARLDYVLANTAFLHGTKADSGIMTYQLWNADDDERFYMLSSAHVFFADPRSAIDSAMSRDGDPVEVDL